MAKKKSSVVIKPTEVELFFIQKNADKGIGWLCEKLPSIPRDVIINYIPTNSPKQPTRFQEALAKTKGSVVLTEAASSIADESKKTNSKNADRSDCIYKIDENKK